MLKSSVAKLLLVAVICSGGAACDDEPPTSPTTPRAPVTATFDGSVGPNGAQTHSFTTASSGTVTATLKGVTPDSAVAVGLSLGNWNGTACQIAIANDAATVGAILSGTMSAAGGLCVRVYDVGNIPEAGRAAYSVEVVHP